MIAFDSGPAAGDLPGHLRDRRRRRRHGQCLDRGGHRAWPPAASGSSSTATGRPRDVGQLRRPRAAGSGHRCRAAGPPPLPRRAGHRVPVRPKVPSRACDGVAAVRRQLPFRTIFNLVGPALQPGQPHASARRRSRATTTPGGWPRSLAQAESIRRAVVVTGSRRPRRGDARRPDAGADRRVGHDSRAGLDPRRLRSATGTRPASCGSPGPRRAPSCLRRLFAGDPGPVREIVLANAAAALWTISPGPLPRGRRPRGPGHRLGSRGPAGRALVRADPGEALKPGRASGSSVGNRSRARIRIRTCRPRWRSPARRSRARCSGWRARCSSSSRCST